MPDESAMAEAQYWAEDAPAMHSRAEAPDADEELARAFHEAYERLAPSFGYETRKESSVPWEQVPENNRRLMTAVAGEMRPLIAYRERGWVELVEALKAEGWHGLHGTECGVCNALRALSERSERTDA